MQELRFWLSFLGLVVTCWGLVGLMLYVGFSLITGRV